MRWDPKPNPTEHLNNELMERHIHIESNDLTKSSPRTFVHQQIVISYVSYSAQKKRFFFIPTLYAKKIPNLTPIRFISQNDPLFIFVRFFFFVFLITAIWNGGNEPPLWHMSVRDRFCMFDFLFFFLIFFHSRRLKWRDWIFDFFSSFFCCFWATYV